MKYSLSFCLIFSALISKSQTYNTTINSPPSVKIEKSPGTTIIINNAKIIHINEYKKKKHSRKQIAIIPKANVIIDPLVADQKIHVIDYSQKLDSTGVYVTNIEFGNEGDAMASNVDINVYFDHEFIDAQWYILSPVSFSVGWGAQPDKMGAYFKAGLMIAGKKCILRVKSKGKLFTTITGVSGVSKLEPQ